AIPSSLRDALGVDEAVLDTADPVALGRAFVRALERAALRPLASAPAWLRYGAAMGLATASFPARLVGVRPPDVAAVNPKDMRFRSPVWTENPFFHWLLEAYLLSERLLLELVHSAQL